MGPILNLIISSAVVMGSPGPSTISATAVGAAFGFRRGFSYVSGLVAGTIAVLGAVAIGALALVSAAPGSARFIGAAAALYVLYLAFKIATAPPLRDPTGIAAVPAFLGGFLFALANPKAYLAIGAVYAGTSLVPGHAFSNAASKLALLSAMIVLIHASWLLAGAWLSRHLRHPVRARLINIILAALLVATSAASLFE